MTKWRVMSVVLILILFLAEYGILGFHEPNGNVQTLIIFLAAATLWCICDAVAAIKKP
jgi:hypothetical protein